MRLLNTSAYTLTEFQNSIPPYAILSHMWEREEVTFRDIADLDKAQNMRGFAKIIGACKTAKRDGFAYIWVDTCCINKESSAELSEAINSMCTWYKNARICYAYLWDVPSEGDHNNTHSLFTMSLWFTRGWTLQELIVPQRVIFYGAGWVDIGTKASLHNVISAITGIGMEVITGEISLDDVPVAVRMSWAAGRNTTRVEDVAYSLMGVFDVNMPLLYGEGDKAFIRLQHEIIKKSDDHSIFAWTVDDFDSANHWIRGMLARSPNEFRQSSQVTRSFPSHGYEVQLPHLAIYGRSPLTPYSISNQGLGIDLPNVVKESKTLAFLNCNLLGDPIVITLSRRQIHGKYQYVRHGTRQLETNVKERSTARMSLLRILDDYSQLEGPEIILPYPPSLDLEVKVPPNYDISNITSNQTQKTQLGFHNDALSHPAYLVFDEPSKFKPFVVVISYKKPKSKASPGMAWCGILASNKTLDNDFLATLKKHWTSEKLFPDRASADLTNGWSATVSLAPSSDLELRIRGEVELMQSPGQQQPTPTLVRTAGWTVYLVILPTPQHGFVLDTADLQQDPPNIRWAQNLHSILLSANGDDTVELPFKNTIMKERFYLVLHGLIGHSHIERDSHTKDFYNDQYWLKKKADTYSMDLGNGKSVFVTQRDCQDKSMADRIITLSM